MAAAIKGAVEESLPFQADHQWNAQPVRIGEYVCAIAGSYIFAACILQVIQNLCRHRRLLLDGLRGCKNEDQALGMLAPAARKQEEGALKMQIRDKLVLAVETGSLMRYWRRQLARMKRRCWRGGSGTGCAGCRDRQVS